MGREKKTPNQFLPYVGGNEHSILMAELSVLSLRVEIDKAKSLLGEWVVYHRKCPEYDRAYASTKIRNIKKDIKTSEDRFEQVKEFLISQGYHPITLTKITA